MLGFYEHEAIAYARERGWTIRRGSFLTTDDRLVVYLHGAHISEASRFMGLEVARKGGIIFGPYLPCSEVIEFAETRARL